MLLELRVKDFGIIEEINWSLGSGLNVITGETGAGKSLVVDALEALLAGNVCGEVIRHGADEACLEGVFSLPKDESFAPLRELLAQNGLVGDEELLVINGEFRRQGRRLFRVNRQAVSRGLLHQIGRFLIDIYGQSEHLSLLNIDYHLDFLDAYARTLELRRRFTARALQLAQVEQELKVLVEQEKDLARREEFLRFQVDEIRQAELREEEETALERERAILASAEKLKAVSYEAYRAIYGDEASLSAAPALDRLNEAVLEMKKVAELDASLRLPLEFLEETISGLTEVAREIRAYSDRQEYDPKQLEAIELRLEGIRSLKRKYGQTVTEILDHLVKIEKELEGLSHLVEKRPQLEETRHRLREEMEGIAFELSQARGEAAVRLIAQVKKELQDLNMSRVEFEVALTREPASEGILFPDGECYAFTKEGADRVAFMAATNPGEPLKPLARIASTGEISRFMLALKGALAEADSIPVLIFDEIDIGVGGRSGEIVGRKLWTLGCNRQVICVTHLPQIAAFADAHYNVHKETAGRRTLSVIQVLRGDSQIGELAVMLGGPQRTEASLRNARELVQKAGAWKEDHGGGIKSQKGGMNE
ncbi:MAG: DNA repair protein RecN [Dehalococcoidales bacterium]|nr:DNA repair protein RecN [Dehalococcoidales bacterium]